MKKQRFGKSDCYLYKRNIELWQDLQNTTQIISHMIQ
jgi:hypothetical protein